MDTEERYLSLDVTGLGELPSRKHSLFYGVAKLVYLKMCQNYHEAVIEEMRAGLFQELRDYDDDVDTVALGQLMSSV